MTSDFSSNGSRLPVFFRASPQQASRETGNHRDARQDGFTDTPAALATLLSQPQPLESLLDQLPNGLIACDLHGQVHLMNAAARHLLTADPNAALPDHISALQEHFRCANGEKSGAQETCIERVLRGETVTGHEERLVRPDGTAIAVFISGAPLHGAEGEVVGAVLTLVDITAHKRDEKAFRAYAAAIMEHSDEPIIGRTLDGTIVTWNSGAERVYGYRASEAVGRPISMLFPPGSADEHQLMIERLRHGEQVLSIETKRVRKDGSIVDISLSASPILDEQGTLIGVSAISHDITARKETERAEHAGQDRFRQLADSMPQLVWTALPDGTVDYYNQRHQEYQGIAPSDAAGWQWAPVLHPDDLSRTMKAWQRALKTGESYEIEHRVYRSDGSLRWVLSRAVPVRDEADRVIRWYGTATDIHDQKMAEDALRRANDQISAILNSISDGFFTLDNEWKFTYFNDAAEWMLHLNAEDVLGRHFLEVFPTASGSIFEDRYAWAMQHHQSTAFEAYFDTEPYANWYDVRVYPRKNGVSIYFQIITERKRSESIIQAQARLLDQMHDAILVWDREGRIVQWYRGAERLYGWSAEEAVGQTTINLMKTTIAVSWGAIESALQRNGRWNGEIEHIIKDGRQIIVESQMTLVRGADDQEVVLEINRDVTERKWAEQIVAQSHAEVLEQRRRLQTVLAALPVGVMIADKSGRLVEANEQVARIWGGTPVSPAIPERREYQGWRADTGAPLAPEEWPLARAITTGEITISDVVDIERFDGERRTVLNSAAPIRDEQGNITGGVVAITDITAQKELEKALRESEQRFRTVLENMPIMLLAWDGQGHIVAWNRECEHVTGYSAREIVHNPHALELLLPDPAYRENIFTAWTNYGGDIRNFEVMFTGKDGSIRHLSWANISGRFPVQGWESWAVGVDISERKEAEFRQLELVSERERVRVLTEFVRNISHDFKTPLSTINTSLYLLKKQNDVHKQERHMEIMQQQISRLTRLLEGLLTMTRLDSYPDLTYRPLSLSQLIASVEGELQASAKDKGIRLILEGPQDMRPIEGDEIELTRAIVELVANAIQFTAAGGAVTLRLRQVDNANILEVEDTGIGMAAEELPRIFERLYRIDKARSTSTGGLGLGLSIARRIVELHRGRIEVDSMPGRGSTFRVYLPASMT